MWGASVINILKASIVKLLGIYFKDSTMRAQNIKITATFITGKNMKFFPYLLLFYNLLFKIVNIILS
jgi:hypothetical protein